MTNTPNEFKLLKGSSVKIGDMPYLLTQDTIVSGFSEPRTFEPETPNVELTGRPPTHRRRNEVTKEHEPQNVDTTAGGMSELNAGLGAWLPIETAPKDGTWVLVVIQGYIPSVAQWNADYAKWLTEIQDDVSEETWEELVGGEYKPMYWMQLPDATNGTS